MPIVESTIAQENDALKHVAARLTALKPNDRHERSLLEAMIVQLEGDVGFRLFLALRSMKPQRDDWPDLSAYSTDELLKAVRSCITPSRGAKPDSELLSLARQVADLYENGGRRARGARQVTHSDSKTGEHMGRPLSAFGQVFECVVRDIDPAMPSTRISRVLKALVHERRRAA